MVNINIILPIFMLIISFMCFPLLIQFAIKKRLRGKHLCAIIEKGRPLTIKLLKITKDDFVKDKDDEWVLKPNLMKPVDYPIGWPSILQGFQQTVWCSLLMRGRADPLDWENPPVGALSSKELPVILDPHWMINFVKGAGEGPTQDKNTRMFLLITVAGVILNMLLVFYAIYKMGIIERMISR